MNLYLMNLSRGQRVKNADLVPDSQEFRLGVSVNTPGWVVDFACFRPDIAGRFPSDAEQWIGLINGGCVGLLDQKTEKG